MHWLIPQHIIHFNHWSKLFGLWHFLRMVFDSKADTWPNREQSDWGKPRLPCKVSYRHLTTMRIRWSRCCVQQRDKKEPESLETTEPWIQPTLEIALFAEFYYKVLIFSLFNHFESGVLFFAAKSILIGVTGKSNKIDLFIFKYQLHVRVWEIQRMLASCSLILFILKQKIIKIIKNTHLVTK